jgi:hypothetical protein
MKIDKTEKQANPKSDIFGIYLKPRCSPEFGDSLKDTKMFWGFKSKCKTFFE